MNAPTDAEAMEASEKIKRQEAEPPSERRRVMVYVCPAAGCSSYFAAPTAERWAKENLRNPCPYCKTDRVPLWMTLEVNVI